MENNNNVIKYIVKTDNDRIYSLYIMEANEYKKGKYVSLFLYYDENDFNDSEELWLNLRHRILYESSIDAIKNKIIEYADGRNEKLIFLEIQNRPVHKY